MCSQSPSSVQYIQIGHHSHHHRAHSHNCCTALGLVHYHLSLLAHIATICKTRALGAPDFASVYSSRQLTVLNIRAQINKCTDPWTSSSLLGPQSSLSMPLCNTFRRRSSPQVSAMSSTLSLTVPRPSFLHIDTPVFGNHNQGK
jgi:hypothetical protein